MDEDELANLYRQKPLNLWKKKRQSELPNLQIQKMDGRLRSTPLKELMDSDELVAAIISRLGMVRAALEGHGGGIKVEHISEEELGLDLILNLDGACIACGAAPGTLQGIQADLLATGEVWRIRFSESLLDTFDELGREFVLKFGNVTFV
ncbi:MAG: hypothetical protein Ct9H90mP16_10260 [Candidatus Poseidoniales archaeon]|nr:MAG: hypothetical protein Ct9H90mP16_10260 [Candidatus Poseidoniales archaeon]